MSIRKRFIPLVAVVTILLILSVACASTRTAGEQFDDATISTKIESKLAADPEVSAFNVDVDTINGIVTLRGEVEKASARTEAYELALNTKGVQEVRNEIRVVSPAEEDDEELSDGWITTKVKAKITADPQLNPFNIDVDTEDGVVILSGIVESEESRQEAEKLARDTKGVVDVDNHLEVERG